MFGPRHQWCVLLSWLVIETSVNLYMGLSVIPNLFFKNDFVTTQMFNPTENPDCIRNFLNYTLKEGINPASVLLAPSEVVQDITCYKNETEVLWETVLTEWQTTKDMAGKKLDLGGRIAHMFNAAMLMVCGFLAPFGEMFVRVIINIVHIFNLRKCAPRTADWLHKCYEFSHAPLQHLTQFKLYLCFLQMLLSINIFGIDVITLYSGPGISAFVRFVAWSMFINTIIKKIELPILEDMQFSTILPHPDWIPKVFSTYTGTHARSRTIINMVKLYGFYMWWTLPVFTLVFEVDQPQGGSSMCPIPSVKYYTSSFLSLRDGLEKLRSSSFSLLMTFLLFFQIFVCNLAIPVAQLVQVLLQDLGQKCLAPYTGQPSLQTLQAKPLLDGRQQRRFSLEFCNSPWWKNSLALFLQCCAENQAHEYFVCAFAALLFVLSTIFKNLGLNRLLVANCAEICVTTCFNPMICFWLLCSVPLLGRARAKLHLLDERLYTVLRHATKVKYSRKYIMLLCLWTVTALMMAYVMVFGDTDTVHYFGFWTVQPWYVKNRNNGMPFDCVYYSNADGTRNSQCVSIVGHNNTGSFSETGLQLRHVIAKMLNETFTGKDAWSAVRTLSR